MAERATAVIGYGVTGQGAVNFLCAQETPVVVLDTRPWPSTLPTLPGVEFHFECERWPDIDVERGILSPGLGLDSCLVQEAKARGITLVSDIDVFFEAVDKPVIGITGTNGKSTVTSMVAHLLNSAKTTALAGGNLSPAALELLGEEAPDIYVLELSSFQLERSQTHKFAGAAILNITEDHIDQHGDLEHYVSAKQRIYANAERNVYNRQDAATQPPQGGCSFGLDEPPREDDFGISVADGKPTLMHGQAPILPVDQLALGGAHNHMNALAAAALTAPFISDAEIGAGLKSFAGLAHRFEQVLQHQDVTFIDDSKATNVGATQAALSGLSDVVLIAGGDAKGADLSPLTEVLEDAVKALVTLGKDGEQIALLAQSVGIPHRSAETMAEAVKAAYEFAEPGNMVVLSPACSSLDMFANYGERGRLFKQAVLVETGQAAEGLER